MPALSRALWALTTNWRGIRECHSISEVGDTVCSYVTKPTQDLSGLIARIIGHSGYDNLSL